MSTEMLLAKEKLIKAIRTYLKNNNQPPKEKSIAVLLAEESILTVMQTLEEKQIDTESMQGLLLQLSRDLPTLESIDETPPSDAITPDLPITHSLDSDSLMEEIDIFLVTDDSIPPGIDSDGYNSEVDNLFLEYEPDPVELTRVVVEDIFREPRVHMPNVLPPIPPFVRIWTSLFLLILADLIFDPLSPVFETLLPFSSEIEDKVFNPGIPISK
ncbi:hypothetical protein Tco_1403522 [Tanacetum coccineum]